MSGQHLRVFVATGNSAPFPRLLRAVASLAANAADVELFVQRGFGSEDFVALPGTDFVTREEFAERLQWADLVVCHAGAGTIYEARLAGHVPIVVPREKRHGEHVNDHQLELARAVADAGDAVLCTELEDLGNALSAARRRGPERTGGSGTLVQAVDAALTDHTAPRRRTGWFTVIGDLWRRSRT